MKTVSKAGLAVLLAATAFVVGCTSRSESSGRREASAPKPEKPQEAERDSTDRLSADLRQAVERFIEAAEHSDSATVASMYDPDFVNIRVVDDGTVVRLGRDQVLSILSQAGGHHIPTKSTTIHHVEVVADSGFVLLTRIKDLGGGWEPMFYSLVWKRQGDQWLMSREFVHQRRMPKSQSK